MCVSHGAQSYEGQSDNHPPYMSVNLFKTLVDQYVNLKQRGTKAVSPQFQGEPLLHPQFIELCEYLEEKEMEFGFSSNATLLTPDKAVALLSMDHFRGISFSIDGATKETYERIRVNAKYEMMLENSLKFIEASKDRRKAGTLTVSVNFTEQPDNQHETFQFIQEWVDKVDFVSTSTVAVKGRPIKLRWQPKRVPCRDLWHFMIILTNGQVVPCCRDYLYEFDLGNVNEQSIEDIWMGEKYQSLRDLHRQKLWRQIRLCNDCDTWMVPTKRRDSGWITPNIKLIKGPFFSTAYYQKPNTPPSNIHSSVRSIFGRVYQLSRKLLNW
jgi:radical SAM protein with 4Fe4S-binding SPASM domain